MKREKRKIILFLGMFILICVTLTSKNIKMKKIRNFIYKNENISRKNPIIYDNRKPVYTITFKCNRKTYELDYLTEKVVRVRNILENKTYQLTRDNERAGEYYYDGDFAIRILADKIYFKEEGKEKECQKIIKYQK